MMYLSLIITFLLLLCIIVAGIQNSMSIELEFFTWNLHLPLMALIFYSSLMGAGIVAVLALPKLASKSLKVRRLNNEIYELKKRAVDLEKDHEEGA
jgi:uncharacterized integral membrane protein